MNQQPRQPISDDNSASRANTSCNSAAPSPRPSCPVSTPSRASRATGCGYRRHPYADAPARRKRLAAPCTTRSRRLPRARFRRSRRTLWWCQKPLTGGYDGAASQSAPATGTRISSGHDRPPAAQAAGSRPSSRERGRAFHQPPQPWKLPRRTRVHRLPHLHRSGVKLELNSVGQNPLRGVDAQTRVVRPRPRQVLR
jgi:hypothetical protein